MAVALSTLVEEADRYLGSARIQDYCPNGLQVEGRPQVSRIVSGVTASQALLDAAVEANADLVLVHHGYFWKGENPCITGMKQRRLRRCSSTTSACCPITCPSTFMPTWAITFSWPSSWRSPSKGRWTRTIRASSGWSAHSARP
jgi:hypothetical protein